MRHVIFFMLAASACHASCDESSGAAPVVEPSEAAVLGAPMTVPPRRSMTMRPTFHPAASSTAPTAATGED